MAGLRIALSSTAILTLLACSGHSGSDGTLSNSVDVAAPSVAPSGLAPAEETALKQSARSFLIARTWGWPVTQPKPCSAVFSVGEPQLIDSSLGPQTGKIRIVVPITGENPLPTPAYVRGGEFPWRDCYGVTDQGWPRGKEVPVTLDLGVERWASGWRVASAPR